MEILVLLLTTDEREHEREKVRHDPEREFAVEAEKEEHYTQK